MYRARVSRNETPNADLCRKIIKRMEDKERSSIAVSTKTRQQLNAMRGKCSTDDFLQRTFELLKFHGIDPSTGGTVKADARIPNCGDVMKRLEDVIKIIKSVEKGLKGKLLSAPDVVEPKAAPSASDRRMKEMQEIIDQLREDLAANGLGECQARLRQMYQMTTDFLDQNTGADGSLFVGKARTSQFRASLKEVIDG